MAEPKYVQRGNPNKLKITVGSTDVELTITSLTLCFDCTACGNSINESCHPHTGDVIVTCDKCNQKFKIAEDDVTYFDSDDLTNDLIVDTWKEGEDA